MYVAIGARIAYGKRTKEYRGDALPIINEVSLSNSAKRGKG